MVEKIGEHPLGKHAVMKFKAPVDVDTVYK